ncbi:MAG: hypothetical protein ABFE01_07825 [Phycisphaerales bacterium]
MTTHIKISFVTIAAILAGSSIMEANEPNDAGIAVKFEVESTGIGPLSSRLAGSRENFGPWRPAYAAGVPLKGPGRYLSVIGLPGAHGFIRFAMEYEGLSTEQKQFLQATEGLLNANRESGPAPQYRVGDEGADRPRQLLLYAMTMEDAKAMAQAYVQFVMGRWRRDIDAQEGYIREFKGAITAAQERIRELEKTIGSSEQTLNSLKQRLPYRTEKEAMEAIAELDRMLNAAQVDIAGIRSRIKAIQDYQTGKSPLDETIKAKLQIMFVEESIALQGAEARKKMATQLRTDANGFLDVQRSLVNAKLETEQLQQKIAASSDEMQKAQYRLEMVMAEKPKFGDYAIAIYSVEWAADGQTH